MSDAVSSIYIVDDDSSVRTGVGRLLRGAGYQVSVYSSAGDLLQNMPPAGRGCILLDVQMPGMTGPQLQAVLAKMGSALPIVFLTGHGDIPSSVRAIKAGAEDFLAKPAPKTVLLAAVERALKRYDQTYERGAELQAKRELHATLTPRERQVFKLVVVGKLNKQIAYELGTSERTIKAHRHSIMQKLNVKTVAELVSFAEKLTTTTENVGAAESDI